MKTYLKAFRLKRFWLLLLLPAAFLLDFAARQSADFAEWYAVTIYPVYAQFFSAITGVFPFSVGEFCLIALVLFILAYLIHGVYKLIRHKEGRFAYFVRFLSVPVLIATCIAFFVRNELRHEPSPVQLCRRQRAYRAGVLRRGALRCVRVFDQRSEHIARKPARRRKRCISAFNQCFFRCRRSKIIIQQPS